MDFLLFITKTACVYWAVGTKYILYKEPTWCNFGSIVY